MNVSPHVNRGEQEVTLHAPHFARKTIRPSRQRSRPPEFLQQAIQQRVCQVHKVVRPPHMWEDKAQAQ